MKLLLQSLKRFFSNDWSIGLLLLAVYVLTNGYTYGWDDQHLEIPLLKNLINPQLYAGDYYVESLSQNFSSFLYPLLAAILRVPQIPSAYLLLYLLSRFFFLFFSFKLWKYISGETSTAVLAVLMFLSLGRVEEFLYRTFSHQEFALAIIFAGVFLFYKERFLWAAAVLGLAANFHSLYSLFPFLYMLVYLCLAIKEHGWHRLLTTIFAFMICALPVLIWARNPSRAPDIVAVTPTPEEWLGLYKLACPQNFIFLDQDLNTVFSTWSSFWRATRHYWSILLLFILNISFNQDFRRDKKTHAVMITGFLMVGVSFILTYIKPNRFVLDLNLIRNLQFISYFLIGYTVILLRRYAYRSPAITILLLTAFLPFFRFGEHIFSFSVIALAGGMLLTDAQQRFSLKNAIGAATVLFSVFAIGWILHKNAYSMSALWAVGLIVSTLLLTYLAGLASRRQEQAKFLLLWIPVIGMLCHFGYYHYQRINIERRAESGYWQLNKSWIDMQHYVRENTPQDAMLLVPYDMTMGGFRIFSERKIVCSYRDCGIVGFDFAAARIWQERVKDIEPFKVFVAGDITPAIEKAIVKYKVNYIVFMNYLAPKSNNVVQLEYRNGVYSLYKVLVNVI